MLGGEQPWTWHLLAQRTLGTVMVTVTEGCQGHELHLCASVLTAVSWWCRSLPAPGNMFRASQDISSSGKGPFMVP